MYIVEKIIWERAKQKKKERKIENLLKVISYQFRKLSMRCHFNIRYFIYMYLYMEIYP